MPIKHDPSHPDANSHGLYYEEGPSSQWESLPAPHPEHPVDGMAYERRGNMTIGRSTKAPLPLRSPTVSSGTTSTVADEMQKRLDNDLLVREAIYKDGQTPETFDIRRGAHSTARDGDTRSSEELKDAVMGFGGETERQRAFRKAGL